MLLVSNKTLDKLKYDLVRDGLVELDGLNSAQENAEKKATNLSEELIRQNLLSEKSLLNFIQEKLHIPYVELSDYKPDISCLKYISHEDAQKYNIFPLFKIEDVLTIAMSDPLDLFAINNIFTLENITIEPVVCAENAIREAISKYYDSPMADSQDVFWTQRLLTENLSDEIISQIISDIIKNAIDEKCSAVYFERTEDGINVCFDKKQSGFIPNILAARFVYELAVNYAKMAFIDESIPQNTRFDFLYDGREYSVVTGFLPTKFGARISLLINNPLPDISSDLRNKMNLILEAPAFIGFASETDDNFIYAVAEYIAQTKSVLMVENIVKYALDNVAQVETGKNTGIYFDEILKHAELQNFEAVFWEKIYTKEQFEKLKLLSKERFVFARAIGNALGEFDFIINGSGKVS